MKQRHKPRASSSLKDEQCRQSKCPNYIGPTTGKAVNENPVCAHCTGPVEWKDKQGRVCGSARACTSCPMNGAGLPVCWAACRGPSEVFGTDGQKIVTFGGIDDETAFVAKFSIKGAAKCEDENSIARSKTESRMIVVISRLLTLDGKRFQVVKEIFASAKGVDDNSKAMNLLAQELCLPRQLKDDIASIMKQLVTLTAVQWEIVRGIALGENQAKIAAKLGVRKQAVNQHIDRLGRNLQWVNVLTNRVNPMSSPINPFKGGQRQQKRSTYV